MKTRALQLLEQFTNLDGAPGFEQPIRTALQNIWASKGHLTKDPHGSLACHLGNQNPHPAPHKPRILLTAHMDEVGFRIQSITPEGFAHFVPIGGWWEHELLGQKIRLTTQTGQKIHGIISSQSPHLIPESQRQKLIPLHHMHLDFGAENAEQLQKWGVRLGDPITPATQFAATNHPDRYTGKAFDNRSGIAIIAQLAEELTTTPPTGADLILGATVQEEIGLRGAATLGQKIQPDIAIVLECAPADDLPGSKSSTSQGKLGQGTQIRLHDPSAIMDPALCQLAIETAEHEGIPHQIAVRRTGGTDAGRLHLTGTGIRCIVLSTPARSIHSHHSLIDVRDHLATLQLAKALTHRLAEAP